MLGLSDIWPVFVMAVIGGLACLVLQQMKMESESKILQMIVTTALLVNLARYILELYNHMRTLARY